MPAKKIAYLKKNFKIVFYCLLFNVIKILIMLITKQTQLFH